MFGSTFNPLDIVFGLAVLIVAITVHEFSHAFAAERLGDPTPRLMGRLTLNPLPHIDLFGTIILPFILAISGTGFMFGWAKPVQFDAFNLRNPKRDSAVISLAGPLANLLLAAFCSIVIHILIFLSIVSVPKLLVDLLVNLLAVNVVLAVFNLLPIHPLDGFKIVGGILPEEYARQWAQLEGYGMIFLIVLILPLGGGASPISQLISPVINVLLSIFLPSTRFI